MKSETCHLFCKDCYAGGVAQDVPARGSRAQQIAAELEAEILASRHPAGTRLGLRTDLIDRFGVSPAVMNEALRILRERSLVTVRPGPNGGVIVDSPPPQVRLGGIDVWHQGLTIDPEQLFDARSHLDTLLTTVALQRATPEDIRAMEWALDDMRAAGDDARAFLDANMRLHLAVARASRIELLAGLYESIVAVLSTTMTKAAFVTGKQELRRHNLQVHADLIAAIRDKDAASLQKLLTLHHQDTVRVT
jgi:DNA-binding FadR family transcriptional regulator